MSDAGVDSTPPPLLAYLTNCVALFSEFSPMTPSGRRLAPGSGCPAALRLVPHLNGIGFPIFKPRSNLL